MSEVLTVDVRCHELLNEIYNTPKVGVEIGVFKGQLSWRLLAANKRMFLYMVDPWRAPPQDDSYLASGDEYASYSQERYDELAKQAANNVRLFRKQYEILRMTSAEAAPRFEDGSLDFVFIDGDHSYEGCKQDIELWWPKVKAGGLVSGHDYRTDKGYGVIQAVDEWVQQCGLTLRTGGNYTWFLTR